MLSSTLQLLHKSLRGFLDFGSLFYQLGSRLIYARESRVARLLSDLLQQAQFVP